MNFAFRIQCCIYRVGTDDITQALNSFGDQRQISVSHRILKGYHVQNRGYSKRTFTK